MRFNRDLLKALSIVVTLLVVQSIIFTVFPNFFERTIISALDKLEPLLRLFYRYFFLREVAILLFSFVLQLLLLSPALLIAVIVIKFLKLNTSIFKVLLLSLLTIFVLSSILYALNGTNKRSYSNKTLGIFEATNFQQNILKTKCNLLKPDDLVEWTVPAINSENVPTKTAVVVRFKNKVGGVQVRGELRDSDNQYVMTGYGSSYSTFIQHYMTPDFNNLLPPFEQRKVNGRYDWSLSEGLVEKQIEETKYLRTIKTKEEAEKFIPNSKFEPNKTYTANYEVTAGRCTSKFSFSFRTGER